jgi:FkbM family methyltransferase
MQLVNNTYVPDGDSYFINYFKGCDVFEQENLDLALSFVTRWCVAIDGGAHVGSWTRYMADKFDCVVAFEPKPSNFECLVLNTEQCNNVILSKFGLSATEHTGNLSQGNNSGCWHVTTGNEIKLRKMPDFGALDFVKLDIEGFEVFALTGMYEQLEKYKPIVLIEEKELPHKPLNYDARKVLESLGYKELAKIGKDVIFGH